MAYTNTSNISTPAQGRKPPPGTVPLPTGPGGLLELPDPLDPQRRTPGQQAAAKKRRQREIMRRQRLLRQNGYTIKIDGIWGPRSQQLWNRYLKKRSVVVVPVPGERTNLVPTRKNPIPAPTVREETKAATERENRIARVQAAEAKERFVKRQREAERKAILDRAAKLRLNPESATKMTVPQIMRVLTDKEVDYHPDKNANLTKALQYKLQANGYKVKPTGKFDKATFNAIKKAEVDAIAAERKQQTQYVIDALYRTGLVKPGDKPYWSPVPIPEPGKLLDMVQSNTFSGALLLEALFKQALTPQAGWRLVQAKTLSRIAASTAGPMAPSVMQSRVAGASSVPLWQYMIDIMGVQDFVPFGDYSIEAGYTEEERRKALTARSKHTDTIKENAMNREGTVGWAKLIANTTTAKDFQSKLMTFQREQEEKFKQIQLSIASADVPWYGDVANALSWTSRQISTGMVFAHGNQAEALRSAGTGGSKGMHQVNWEEAERQKENMNPWGVMFVEIVVDPLNFARPVRYASTAAAISLARFGRGASLGRYVLTGGDDLAKTLKYQSATFKKGEMAWRGLHFADPYHLMDSRLGVKMETFVKNLGKTKDEAMSAVGARVRHAAKFGWKAPIYTAKDGTKVVIPKFGSKAAKEWLERTDQEMVQLLTDHPALQRVVTAMKTGDVSLYMNADRSIRSDFGAQLSGYLAESFRPLLAGQLALRIANTEYRTTLRLAGEAGLDEQGMKELVLQARTKAEQDYQTILRGFGTWRAGSPADEIMDWNGRNLAEELDENVSKLMEQTQLILLPAIQDDLERAAASRLARNQKRAKEIAEGIKGTPGVESGSAQDFLRFPEKGTPGYGIEPIKNGQAATFRDEAGEMQGYAMLGDNGSVRTFVSPEFRGKGVASKLYNTAEEAGIPIKQFSGKGPLTEEGAAFARARITKEADAHPMYDDAGDWRGSGAHRESELLVNLRKSFDDPIYVKNHRYGKGHGDFDMVNIVSRELKKHIRRLDDYSARQIAQGNTSAAGAAAHTAEEERIITEITSAWKKGDDGKWYDVRQTIAESRLYARHLGAFDTPLSFVDDGIDVWSALGRATAPGNMSPLEADLLNIAAQMSDVWGGELAGSGFRIQGQTGVFRQHGQKLRDVMDKRSYALRLAEEDALPKMLAEQGALWRAFQYAQSRQMQLAYKGLTTQLALWKFATLALRPAWAVRNMIDNVAKGFIAGARDPRLYIAGPASVMGKKVDTVLQQDIAQMRQMIDWFDTMFNTRVGEHFETIINTLWTHSSETLSRLFKSLDIEVPPEVFEMNLRQDVWDQTTFKLTRVADDDRLTSLGADPSAVKPRQMWTDPISRNKTFEKLWNIMGNHPENYMRRVIYRDEYSKALKELSNDSSLNSAQVHLQATERALAKVEDTLFDYGKISVAEDNLKVFFPFIQFWRKNSIFWLKTFATKPWVPLSVMKFDEARRDAHSDVPAWMERYFHTDEMTDALGVVPGLDKAFDFLGLGNGAMFDPISMSSMAPLYRAFKSENQFLPGDKEARIGFLGAMIDSVNDFGLGMNPFFRKPLEEVGIANYRSWQRVFPQTAMFEAFANYAGVEGLGKLAVSMENIAAWPPGLIGVGHGPDATADNFDYWVQTAVAEQVARGEEPDLKKAEDDIRHWFVVQNLWGYFGGIYWRRATQEDLYIAKLQDDVMKGETDYNSLTAKEKNTLKWWGMRGMDRTTYDRYVGLQPVIEAFYRGDNETKNKIKRENPEIIRWVDGAFTGKPVSQKFIRNAAKYVDQELYYAAQDMMDNLDVDWEIREYINNVYLSPELKAYWEKNETPTRERKRMLQAEMREQQKSLQDGYFAIPEDDFDARDQYLQDHPELPRQWSRDSDMADSYGQILGHSKADLRDVYFKIVEREGFEGGAEFLKEFSFMFEGTPSEKKIKDGEWIPGDGKWSAQRITDFREAKPHLKWFFEEFMPKAGAKEAFKWLENSENEAALAVKAYLKKYPSTKRLEYMRATPGLKIYFGLPPEKRGEWLRGDSEAAKIVRAFFAKYGDKQSQHAQDYLAAKKDLSYYFSIPKEKRNEWLQSDDPRAKKVLEYFKKYGKENQMGRAFNKLLKKYPELANGTPEQSRRMKFWREYFRLTPDQRPAYVLKEAENHGVFIYGEFGEKINEDREQEYLRRATGLGLSKRQAAYLYVKPLLDFYRTLPKDQKDLFTRANPELQWYFDNFSTKSATGSKKLDALVERYFSLPEDSLARSEFLRKHPTVQDWFDKKSTPAERAIRNTLEVYFSLDGMSRGAYLEDHPEIQEYFDQRRLEKDSEREQREAFDDADPRLEMFYRTARDLERSAEVMRRKLRQSAYNSMYPDTLEYRRERRTASAS